MNLLAEKHLAMLRDSAISDAVIAARGYRTVTNESELTALGFARAQCRVPALLLPIHCTDGSNGRYVLRPDNPRVIEDKRKKNPDGTFHCHVLKYEFPKGDAMRVDCPPACRAQLANPQVRLWITEGQKKADALVSAGECSIALLGVWNFKGKNEFGGTTLLADFDFIALDGRDVRIVFDSDMTRNPNVRAAMERLKVHLQRKKAHVSAVYLPSAPDGSKQGVDDFLAKGNTIAGLENLLEAPREQPKPATPIYELLDDEPVQMRRPLALINGHGYAATWVNVKVTLTESVNKKGEIVKHNPPIVQTEKRLMIVRGDGRIFGDGGDAELSELGYTTRLDEIPPADKTWSAKGIKQFRSGYRPDPADVFKRIVETIDRFIDFDRSLADQPTMASLIACYVFATYLIDAFTVIGYLYPNGDRGSGKTQLLQVICELAYLGMVILAGGSYATLRDMADYGATLAFDDAEGLSDPRRTDPDKRNLLLAGNRRGNTVSVKEEIEGKWCTRYVNTFCPRLFSATQFPDTILASRTIIIPLIRTPDRYRANADPLDYTLWQHDRRSLIDDLWATAVTHIHELPRYEARVNESASLSGRNLEPWRAVLAVAWWLDDKGVQGLGQRLEQLSGLYQSERPNLETADMTALVIQALAKGLGDAEHGSFATKDITSNVKQIAQETELDIDEDKITARRIGKALGRMRLAHEKNHSKARAWRVTRKELERWQKSYGIETEGLNPNVRNVPNAPNVRDYEEEKDIMDIKDIEDVSKETPAKTKMTRTQWLAQAAAWLERNASHPNYADYLAEYNRIAAEWRAISFRAEGVQVEARQKTNIPTLEYVNPVVEI